MDRSILNFEYFKSFDHKISRRKYVLPSPTPWHCCCLLNKKHAKSDSQKQIFLSFPNSIEGRQASVGKGNFSLMIEASLKTYL